MYKKNKKMLKRVDEMEFDNVFNTEVMGSEVRIMAGHCSDDALKKDVITDDDVSNKKEIVISAADYKMFMNMVISLGIQLQKEHGVDLGLNLKGDNRNEENE